MVFKYLCALLNWTILIYYNNDLMHNAKLGNMRVFFSQGVISWFIPKFDNQVVLWAHYKYSLLVLNPLMLVVANLANTKLCKNNETKWLKPCHMGTYLRVLSKSYPMNTNMTGFGWFSKIFAPCALDESSLSIGRSRLQRIWILKLRLDAPCLLWYGSHG